MIVLGDGEVFEGEGSLCFLLRFVIWVWVRVGLGDVIGRLEGGGGFR